MRITHNISAIVTQGSLFRINRDMGKSLEKLSTGYRINTAADDAAGLGVSENLRTQVRGMSQALRNTQDAISLLNIADGALNEQAAIMQRMRELVVQAKNDTYTQTERDYMGTEFDSLMAEIDRIANTTNSNSMTLFAVDDTGDNFNGDPKMIQSPDPATWAADPLISATDNGNAKYFNMMVGANYSANDQAALRPENYYTNSAENLITIRLGQMDSTALFLPGCNDGGFTTIDWYHDNGMSTNSFQCDTNWTDFVDLGTMTASLQGKLNAILQIIDGDAPTSADALTMLGTNTTGLKRINTMRAQIGAMTNRLESNIQSLQTGIVNQQAAESLIRDTDFASETAHLTKLQILSQSATAMLAQANSGPQSILQLLR